jgi:flavodoxin
MRTCVLYFSRTGNTKRMAEAISESTKAPAFDIASSEPSVVEDFDLLSVGTPVEGSRPTKEASAFIERLPKAEGKKAILFCTYALWKGSTFKVLEKEPSSKGYDTILSVSKKGVKPDKSADFSYSINKIKKCSKNSRNIPTLDSHSGSTCISVFI